MTAIQSAGAASSPTQSNATQPASQLAAFDPNSFLKMLVAELRYQDPTKPMDSTQLVQQLSSMSQVEQSAQTNSKLGSILDQLSIGQASSLIGRTVSSKDGSQTGIIQSIQISSSGPLAQLSDGSQLLLGEGIKIAP